MILFDVAVCSAVFALAYLVLRAAFSRFARGELQKSERVKRKAGVLQIFADAQSLEYYIRMALLSEPMATVIVNIDRNSKEADELLYIAGVFARNSKNLKINYIN